MNESIKTRQAAQKKFSLKKALFFPERQWRNLKKSNKRLTDECVMIMEILQKMRGNYIIKARYKTGFLFGQYANA